MRPFPGPFLALGLGLAACGGPAASPPAVAPGASALTAPSEADTREISLEVAGLI